MSQPKIINYDLPKHLPKDIVLMFYHYNSESPQPILATVESCVWDERYKSWRYSLAGINITPLEEKLQSYQRGIFIQKVG